MLNFRGELPSPGELRELILATVKLTSKGYDNFGNFGKTVEAAGLGSLADTLKGEVPFTGRLCSS